MMGFVVRELNNNWMGVARFDTRKLDPRYKVKGYDGSIRFIRYSELFEAYEVDLVGFAEAKVQKYMNELIRWNGR